jgi:ComF family protein
VHELKYRSRRRVADRLAERIWADRDVASVLAAGAVLVPVPLHPRRLRARGFNQAELLAVSIGRRASLRVAPRALLRRRDTPAQTGLSAAGRRRNVAGAFAVRQPETIRGRTVVLVDDVLTTGATVRACARELSRAGARGVHVLTVARVP